MARLRLTEHDVCVMGSSDGSIAEPKKGCEEVISPGLLGLAPFVSGTPTPGLPGIEGRGLGLEAVSGPTPDRRGGGILVGIAIG